MLISVVSRSFIRLFLLLSAKYMPISVKTQILMYALPLLQPRHHVQRRRRRGAVKAQSAIFIPMRSQLLLSRALGASRDVRHLHKPSYADHYTRSRESPAEFWAEQAQTVEWFRPWDKVLTEYVICECVDAAKLQSSHLSVSCSVDLSTPTRRIAGTPAVCSTRRTTRWTST